MQLEQLLKPSTLYSWHGKGGKVGNGVCAVMVMYAMRMYVQWDGEAEQEPTV